MENTIPFGTKPKTIPFGSPPIAPVANATQITTAAPVNVSIMDVIKGLPKATAQVLFSNEINLGTTIGGRIVSLVFKGKITKATQDYITAGKNILSIADTITDTSEKKRLTDQATVMFKKAGAYYKEAIPGVEKTGKQIFGEALGVGMDVATLLAPKPNLKTLTQGAKTGTQAFMTGAKALAPAGVAIGAGYGVSQAAQQNKPYGQIGAAGVVGGVTGGAISGLIGGLTAKEIFQAPQKAEAIRQKAIEQYRRGLGATKEKYKQQANKIIPQLLDEGWVGTRKKLLEKAYNGVKLSEQQYYQLGELVGSVETIGLLDNIDNEIAKYTLPSGRIPSVNETKVATLKNLKADIMAIDMMDNITDKAATQEGLRKLADAYGQELFETRKSMKTVMDSKTLSQVRKVDASIRQLLATKNPEYAAINKTYHLNSELMDILNESALRDQGKSPITLKRILTFLGSGGAGLATKNPVGAILFPTAVVATTEIANSTWWNTMKAVQKNKLAEKILAQSGSKLVDMLVILARQGIKYAELLINQ